MSCRQACWPGVVLAAILTVPACAGEKGSAYKKKGAERGGADKGTAVLQIGSRRVTLEEVDRRAMSTNVDAYNKLYEARRGVIDQIVSDALLDGEAQSKGLSRDALIEQEVTAKIAPVGEADVQAFYEQNKNGMQGRTLEQVAPQIQAYLGQQRRQEAMSALLKALRQKADVKVMLEPPRVEVLLAANDPTKGPADAPIQILEFSEFQ